MINPVSEIPMTATERRQTFREMIRQDIETAISKGIDKFEFAGDYNWGTMPTYAREVADEIWRRKFFDMMKEMKQGTEVENYHKWYSRMPDSNYKGKYIKISGVKLVDRVHIYCRIDFEAPERICKEVLEKLKADKAEDDKRAERVRTAVANHDLGTSIEDLGLTVRAYNCLSRAGVRTVGDLIGLDLSKVRNLGRKSTEEVEEVLKRFEV